MVVSLKIVSNVSRFKPALNLNRVLVDLSRDLNSLNSASVYTKLSWQDGLRSIYIDFKFIINYA